MTWRTGLSPAAAGVPVGGTTGQLLAKSSAAPYDTGWVAPVVGVPAAGTMGQVLGKASGADYHVAWITPPPGIPAAGAAGQVLAKNSGIDFDVSWTTPASGNVVGPTSAVDNRLAAFDGVTGKLLKDSGLALSAAAITFLTTPTSANLRALLSDESGTGAALFAGGVIGAATGTSLSVTGALITSGVGVGYTTGAGGAVTQLTSKATGVTLNKLCGNIVTNNASLTVGTSVSFVVTNSTVQVNDFVDAKHISGGTLGNYNVSVTPAAGSFTVTITALLATLAEALTLKFMVFKATVA